MPKTEEEVLAPKKEQISMSLCRFLTDHLDYRLQKPSISNYSCSGHFGFWEDFRFNRNIAGRGTPPQS